MEYIKGGGWQASPANSLIYNFKKDLKKINESQYIESQKRYRKDAIDRFYKDLSDPMSIILQKYKKSINISFIPTSKSKKDSEYNDRFELVCKKLKAKFQNNISFHFPIEVITSRKKSSQRQEFRGKERIKELKDNFCWINFPSNEPGTLVIFDDVITTGSQFKAYKEFLLEKMKKEPKIIGLFWAKAIQDVSFPPISEGELKSLQDPS